MNRLSSAIYHSVMELDFATIKIWLVIARTSIAKLDIFALWTTASGQSQQGLECLGKTTCSAMSSLNTGFLFDDTLDRVFTIIARNLTIWSNSYEWQVWLSCWACIYCNILIMPHCDSMQKNLRFITMQKRMGLDFRLKCMPIECDLMQSPWRHS